MSKEQSAQHHVTSGEYKILPIKTMDILTTTGLGSEIAFTAYAPLSGKAALARSLSNHQITTLFQELTENKPGESLEIRLFNGDRAAEATQLDALISSFQRIDQGHHRLNIITSDINKNQFDSFEFAPQYNSLSPHIVTTPTMLATPKSILPAQFEKNNVPSGGHSR